MGTLTERLTTLIETERIRFGVPGAAVSIVRGDEPVLEAGFGELRLGAGRPVTADTRFALASDTKAFTAGWLAGLAEQGLLDLDQPLRDYVPEFRMHDPAAERAATMRDLLAHRTGLPAHEFVGLGPEAVTISNHNYLRALAHLEPSTSFRARWQYSNIHYEAAAAVGELVSSESWWHALRSRFIEPLGMADTTASLVGERPDRLAAPHQDHPVGTVRVRDLPGHDTTGPSGGLVTTARDLTQWLTARLGHRPNVLSDKVRIELAAPVSLGITVADPFGSRHVLGYGLGCSVESYRGTKLIRHGGNVDGYSSDVAICPDEQLGVAVLTNLNETALRDTLALLVVDTLLDRPSPDWGAAIADLAVRVKRRRRARPIDDTTDVPAADSRGLPGRYTHPAYGKLELTADPALRCRYRGIAVTVAPIGPDSWRLAVPDHYEIVPLWVRRDRCGDVAGVAIGFEPAVAPIEFRRRADESLKTQLANPTLRQRA
jgi:CubicO group peptidase (beta-lactamase class C family)